MILKVVFSLLSLTYNAFYWYLLFVQTDQDASIERRIKVARNMGIVLIILGVLSDLSIDALGYYFWWLSGLIIYPIKSIDDANKWNDDDTHAFDLLD
jgi:hypothetical protein